ncbi:UNVERIFIED_CONTAM: hypothetical protein GTU68_005482 [Idotea baltica]|nr:hypothetical protein [Idotea baltica]
MLEGKKILLGVTGSIAAYKAAFLTRLLIKSGAEVQILMTQAASQFVTPLTFSTLSKREVIIEIVGEQGWNNHVDLGLWADLMIIAPITANTISKLARGACSDMISASYLSSRCPVMVAPAMDLDMWAHPAVQRNVKQLQADGVKIIEVGDGELASGLSGPGRMAEPDEILQMVEAHFKKKSKILTGIRALITAGPTYEEIDPVRFIGNRSSGKMGLALVETLLERGAEVDLVLGPNNLKIPKLADLTVHRVVSASEMAKKSKDLWPNCNVAILAAAVADYTPTSRSDQKIKKGKGDMQLVLERTEDIAASLGTNKRADQISIGFALETQDEEQNAIRKVQKKNFDFIVLNSLNDPGAGFQHDTNRITILQADGQKLRFELKPKTEVARDIVDVLEKLIISKKDLG